MPQNSLMNRYTEVGIGTAVAAADPHGLILMLLEGAIEAIIASKREISRKNIPAKGNAISKAISIIQELARSLNVEAGGELAANLMALYEYMSVKLVEANHKNNVEALDEVIQLLSEIKGAWKEIGSRPKSDTQEMSLEGTRRG